MLDGLSPYVYQFALFTGAGSIRADELSSEVRKRLDIGDYDPMLIPEQPGMPEEFPRLQINTAKGYRLTMSKARIDFFLDLPLGFEEEDVHKFKVCMEKLLGILHENNFRYSRVGFIKTNFVANSSPAPFFLNAVTNFSPDSVTDVQLAVTKKIMCSKWQCNSLYSYASGFGGGVVGLLAIRDINTDPAMNYMMGSEDVKDFYMSADAISGVDSLIDFMEAR